MSDNGTIVVGVDGSPGSVAALHWAAQQARLTGSRLIVATAWHYPASYGDEIVDLDDWRPDQSADQAQRDVLRAAEGLADLDVEPLLVEGEPGRALLRVAESAQLLVVGSRGHRELSGMLLGSVSEYCATHAECPVVVVRPSHR